MSRWLIVSVRSGSMLQGANTARLTSTTTSGTRSREARCSCSWAYSSPCDEVAVNVRTPARAAAITYPNIECSLSRFANSTSSRPATSSASRSTISVCGVIG